MYKVLLVDDEPWTLVGIEKSFKWNQKGFEIIAAVTDPLKAMEIIKKEKPDVVFTDIKMPVMTGIQLIQKSRELKIDTEFIIISGYSDFLYARDALRHGAFDYCLKPLDISEADNILDKLSTHLQIKKNNRENEFFSRFIEGRKSVPELMELIGLNCKYSYYQVCIALYSTQINNAVEEPIIPDSINKIDIKLSKRKIFYLINTDNSISDNININYVQSDVSLGISSITDTVDDLVELYKEADMAANSDFIYGSSKNFYKYVPKNSSVVNVLLEKIQDSIIRNELESVETLIKGIPYYFRNSNLYLDDIVYLWNQLVAFITKKYSDKSAYFVIDFATYEQILMEFENIHLLSMYLAEEIRVFLEQMDYEQTSSKAANDAFKKLLAYISEHFGERLLLKELADKFFINASYCCSLFKKVTGETFSQYITKLRMEKASELLMREDYTVGEVAQKTGYNDCFYFSRAFKKYFGTAPSQYKKTGTAEKIME